MVAPNKRKKATRKKAATRRKPAVKPDGPERWASCLTAGIFHSRHYVENLKALRSVDDETKRWIRNANDERAAQEGCRFSEEKGQFAVDWVSNYCHLYEGSKAGELMLLEDWQYEWFMQLYGWQRYDVELNKWVRRFNKADAWIPKKNGKSPTLAANGLYMLIGDGEMGQKCYSAARDGKQAMIAHKHAMHMVRMSPSLDAECKINMQSGTITHVPTRSEFIIVTGQNNRSTEGFNGSVFVDEIHVVDSTLIERIKRAGISREEAVFIEMSTAGDNADGYGHAKYKYGCKVSRGDLYAPDFLFVDFSVDHDNVTIEDYRKKDKVEKMILATNPTLGRIIRKAEALSDYRDSLQSQTELIRFAQYRTNLWTASSANWIDPSDWQRCKKNYTLDDLKDYPCAAGLDLSKTRDMTALTLLFGVPDEDDEDKVKPYSLTYSWLPKPTVERYEEQVDMTPWVRGGWLETCPKKAIDYNLITDRLKWCNDNLDLRCVGYDPYNADTIVDDLEDDFDEEQLVSIGQTMPNMGPATASLERLVLREEMHHNGNPIMRWQIGHCETVRDPMGNKRPCKPEANDYRKVDGIVSLVMATAMFYYPDSDITTESLPGLVGIDVSDKDED
jgi:phage terminase large subunit-like protein